MQLGLGIASVEKSSLTTAAEFKNRLPGFFTTFCVCLHEQQKFLETRTSFNMQKSDIHIVPKFRIGSIFSKRSTSETPVIPVHEMFCPSPSCGVRHVNRQDTNNFIGQLFC